jgi:hypothetical protein
VHHSQQHFSVEKESAEEQESVEKKTFYGANASMTLETIESMASKHRTTQNDHTSRGSATLGGLTAFIADQGAWDIGEGCEKVRFERWGLRRKQYVNVLLFDPEIYGSLKGTPRCLKWISL